LGKEKEKGRLGQGRGGEGDGKERGKVRVSGWRGGAEEEGKGD
jgi:hypothetical protein